MAPPPSQPDRTFLSHLESDVRSVLLRDVSRNAYYRKVGNTQMVDMDLPVVPVVFAPGMTMDKMAFPGGVSGSGGAGGGGAAGVRRVGVLFATGFVDGETIEDDQTGIGTLGNIIRLREGDKLLVPGSVVGQADATVVLVVGRNIRAGVGQWNAECSW